MLVLLWLLSMLAALRDHTQCSRRLHHKDNDKYRGVTAVHFLGSSHVVVGPARKIHPYPCPTDRRNRSCMRHLDDPESTLLSYKLNLSCMQRRQIRKFSAPTTNTTHTRSAVIHNGSALHHQSTFNNHPDPVLCGTAAIGKCSGGQHGHTDTFTVSPLSFIRIASESAGTRSCHHGQTDRVSLC